jgi:uncharacterized protein YegP (UPF0339 family)
LPAGAAEQPDHEVGDVDSCSRLGHPPILPYERTRRSGAYVDDHIENIALGTGSSALRVGALRVNSLDHRAERRVTQEVPVPAKYVIRKGRGKFSFELVSSNGKSVVKSPTYNDKRSAMNALRTVQRSASANVDDQSEPATKTATTGKRATKKTAKKAAKKTARKTAKRATKKTAKKAAKKTARKTAKRTTARKSTGNRATKKAAAKATKRTGTKRTGTKQAGTKRSASKRAATASSPTTTTSSS